MLYMSHTKSILEFSHIGCITLEYFPLWVLQQTEKMIKYCSFSLTRDGEKAI